MESRHLLLATDQTLDLIALQESAHFLAILWNSLSPGDTRHLIAQSLLRLTWVLSRMEIPDSIRSEIHALNQHLRLSLDPEQTLQRTQDLERLIGLPTLS